MLAKHFITVAIAIALLTTPGCAPAKLQPSGFLGDPGIYQAMQPDPEVAGVRVYKTAPFPLAGYDSFIVPPVAIYLNEQGRQRGVDNRELRKLAEDFRRAVIAELGSNYQVTSLPAPRVAILRLAITDADPSQGLLNISPAATLVGATRGGASAEAALVDSVSGETVAAFLASEQGSPANYASGLSKWGHTDAVFKNWAAIIGERVSRSRG